MVYNRVRQISADIDLSSEWARGECARTPQFLATQILSDQFMGKQIVTRMRGVIRTQANSCGFEVSRTFPAPIVQKSGKIKMGKFGWELDTVSCSGGLNVPKLGKINSSSPGVSRSTYAQVEKLRTSRRAEMDPAFVLGDGYYDCKAGHWYVSVGTDNRPRGFLWEGQCTFTKDSSSDFESHYIIYDLKGETIEVDGN